MKKYTYIFPVLLFLFACNRPAEVIDPPTPPVPVNPPQMGYQQYGTPFIQMPATEDVVMYEVNLRAFSQEGTIEEVQARLNQMQALGVNVIWLMPIYPQGEERSVNSPYAIKDFKAVSSEYGDLQSLRTFVDAAHSRGMAVILDWVANHTGWDHPWINTRPDWYTRNSSGEIIHPDGTNWLDVADLNFGSSSMRLEMIDAMKYWILEANVDGYRCDYADGVPASFWKQAIDTLRNIPERSILMLAEGARPDHFDSGFDLNFGWAFYSKMKEVFQGKAGTGAVAIGNTHQSTYNTVPQGKHLLRFTTNHDESAWDQTPVRLFGNEEGALAAFVINTFTGGVPLIYTGQEVGQAETVPFFTSQPMDWEQNPNLRRTYEDVMKVYTEHEVARKGSVAFFSNHEVFVARRRYEDKEMLIIVNTRNDMGLYDVPAPLQHTSWTNVLFSYTYDISDGQQTYSNYDFLLLMRDI
ncbi:MAG: alpha-amylase family glycosyl hydrolase [Bacteroidota bacterium]